MRPAPSLLASALLAVNLFACGPTEVAPPGTEARSTKDRITQAAPAADLEQTVRDTNTFGFDVYQRLASGDENLAFSPYSLTTALAMTYPGARGDTQLAFEKTMRLSLPAERFHRAMNTLDLALESRGQNASGRAGKAFALHSNNQLFAQKGLALVPSFLDVLAVEYGAGVRLLDFAQAPEPSRKAINDWVNVNTQKLIPELIPEGLITGDTRLALVNTLYFNAGWKKPFDRAKTVTGPFTRSDGTVMQVSYMAGDDLEARLGRLGDVDVLELPYSGDEVSLLVLMPPTGKLAAFEASLDGAKLAALVAAATDSTNAVRLPRFEARTRARADDVLKALGLGVAFSSNADFSGLTEAEKLFISAVVHEAVVKTDEDGTEAAAASAVIVGRVSIPQYFEVNRPFVYVVRDRATGAALFVGRITQPPAASN
jgi:serpin B